MASLALGVRFNPVAAGTADFVYSGAVTGYTNPTGLTDGATYRYRAESADLSQWEWGTGAWTASSSTLARTTVLLSSNSNSKVSFTAAPQVSITIFPADVLAAAVKADQVTATSTAVAVVPAVQQNHPSAAKAWVNFAPAGTITDSFNVSGVVKNSTGNWTITFTTAFSDANYAPVVTVLGLIAIMAQAISQTASTATVRSLNSSLAVADPTIGISFVAFGPQ